MKGKTLTGIVAGLMAITSSCSQDEAVEPSDVVAEDSKNIYKLLVEHGEDYNTNAATKYVLPDSVSLPPVVDKSGKELRFTGEAINDENSLSINVRVSNYNTGKIIGSYVDNSLNGFVTGVQIDNLRKHGSINDMHSKYAKNLEQYTK